MIMRVIHLDGQVLFLLRNGVSRMKVYGERVPQIKKELDAKKSAGFLALPESGSADG